MDPWIGIQLSEFVKDNLREYYVIPDSAVSVIEDYVRTRTVNELLDPTLIGEAVII